MKKSRRRVRKIGKLQGWGWGGEWCCCAAELLPYLQSGYPSLSATAATFLRPELQCNVRSALRRRRTKRSLRKTLLEKHRYRKRSSQRQGEVHHSRKYPAAERAPESFFPGFLTFHRGFPLHAVFSAPRIFSARRALFFINPPSPTTAQPEGLSRNKLWLVAECKCLVNGSS